MCIAPFEPPVAQVDASDDVAAAKFMELIDESLHTKATLFNDACHLLKHA